MLRLVTGGLARGRARVGLARCATISGMFMRVAVLAIAAALTLSAQSGQSTQSAPTRAYTLQKLADGVYAAIPTRPPGLLVESNNLFIVNDRDVVVVDTGFSPTLTREVLSELRAITDKPVSAVINTHWHDDHILGNAVYAEAFPGVEFIAHRLALTYLPTTGETNRQGMLSGGKPFVAQIRDAVAKGLNLGGKPITDEERASYLADIAQWEPYERETPGVRVMLPTTPVDDRLVLTRGARTIEIRAIGRGHTAGDLVVYLPNEKIVAAGDLVIAPIPLVGGDQSYVGDWATTLDALKALGATTIVPGHGPVMRDTMFVTEWQALLRSLRQQTDAAIARGETKEQAQRSVDVASFRKSMAGDSAVLTMLFNNYVLGPGVLAVYRER